jgi:hypothetical protein
MARKPPDRKPAKLSIDGKRAAISRLEARVSELQQLEINSILTSDDQKVQELSARIRSTLAQIYGEDSLEYVRLGVAADLDMTYTVLNMTGADYSSGPSPGDIREGLEQGRKRAVALLRGELEGLKESLANLGGSQTSGLETGPSLPPTYNSDIFIVHGHDGPAKIEVTLLVKRAGLNPVILHEQPNAGRTIIEKFETHGGSAGFAIVLLTPDDVGGSDATTLGPRVRQNVIGEMFWFAGKLGRARVCALKKGDVDMPSDFASVGYTEMDDRGAWKHELLRELKAAGYKIDWEKALV